MICEKCGREVAEGTSFCPYCGEKVNAELAVRQDEEEKYKNEKQTIGILAVVFGAMGGLLGLIFGIIGLTTYKNPKNRKLCKIGLWLFGIVSVLFLTWIIILYTVII